MAQAGARATAQPAARATDVAKLRSVAARVAQEQKHGLMQGGVCLHHCQQCSIAQQGKQIHGPRPQACTPASPGMPVSMKKVGRESRVGLWSFCHPVGSELLGSWKHLTHDGVRTKGEILGCHSGTDPSVCV